MLLRMYAALVAVCLLVSSLASETCTSVSDVDKVDCGYVGTTESQCTASGCCWQQMDNGSSTPWCFHPASPSAEYQLSAMTKASFGYQGTLNLMSQSADKNTLTTLKLEFVYESVDTFRVRVTDPREGVDNNGGGKWEIPQSVIERPTPSQVAALDPASLNYEVQYSATPFRFHVVRKADKEVIFDMQTGIVYRDQYIQISTKFASGTPTFGLGESTRLNQALKPGTYTLWAADIAAAAFGRNLYGSYPYYLQLTSAGASHGALLLNSNGMDIVLGSDSLTFKTIGGVVDLYIFSGSTPQAVVQQYLSVAGKPMMPPYWSLGFHNCKYGYTSLAQVESVVAGYEAAGIPLDTQWMDIDYMQDYRDWTWGSSNFPQAGVASFVDGLHSKGMHFVPIVDPGIMVYANYPAYDQGVKQGLFIKDLHNKDFYMGQVWPGPVHFPDFLHPKTQQYWTDSVRSFHDGVKIDGMWIDMNEASNFCNSDGAGQVCVNNDPAHCPTGELSSQTTCCISCSTADSTNKYDFPPYRIGNTQGNGLLGSRAIAPSAWHHNNVSEYNMHNLFGLTEQIATHSALVDVRGERPFLLTRSSFVSTGKHSAKWTGDNAATWQDLQGSVVSIMDFNLFGVPMIGADICGFLGDTTEELCARWIELGAFYPFVRDHSAIGTAPQELYLWPSVTAAAQNALGIRYQMLPYINTLFYQAHTTGETVARSLWLNFPEDKGTHNIVSQFMLGAGVMISPVLTQGSTSVDAYFPKGLWYEFNSRSLAVDASAGATTQWLDTPLTSVNVHILGGTVLPLQGSAMTTTAARATPFKLVVALCPEGCAHGELFVDDGVQVETGIAASHLYVTYKATGASRLVSSIVSNTFAGAASMQLGCVHVLGAKAAPHSATLNGKALDVASSVSFNAATGELIFKQLGLAINSPLDLQWA